jgi:hypothetical protein
VTARRCHLESALGSLLAANVGEISGWSRGLRAVGWRDACRQRRVPSKVPEHGAEIVSREDPDSRSERPLLAVGLRKHHLPAAGLPCGQRERQSPLYRTQAAVERQLPHQGSSFEGFWLDGALGGEDAHGDGEVQAGATLSQPRGGQIDRHPALRESLTGGSDRRSYAGHALPHGSLRKADEVHTRQQRADSHLDLDGDPVDSVQCRAEHAGQPDSPRDRRREGR